MDWIGYISCALHQTIAINVTVTASGYTVNGLSFMFGRWTASVSICVLSEFILSMVLCSDSLCYNYWGRCDNCLLECRYHMASSKAKRQ
uniref:Uncharacterized protein n=1 Tax=Panstrongylus lignarius TaxID=156445 RepID=A0A224XRV4_9HEMI